VTEVRSLLLGSELMSILISGSTGKLGKELARIFPEAHTPTRQELDITSRTSVDDYVKRVKPETIIHCAALTGVRECEENKHLAWKTNVEGTENLVRACLSFKTDVYFCYISTACVFHGDVGDYTEKDIPYPKNFYSLTKLLGEFILKYSGLSKWLVVRTNFVSREAWPYERAFTDRYGTYLFADDLAQALRSVISTNLTGTVHICGDEKLSMFELARITTPTIKPVTLADYNGPPLTVDMSLRSIYIKPFKITRHVE